MQHLNLNLYTWPAYPEVELTGLGCCPRSLSPMAIEDSAKHTLEVYLNVVSGICTL